MYSVVERGNDIHDLSIYMIYLSENGDRDEFILIEGIYVCIYISQEERGSFLTVLTLTSAVHFSGCNR